MTLRNLLCAVLLAVMPGPSWAGNIIVLEEFTGQEATMPIAEEPKSFYCNDYHVPRVPTPPDTLPYRVIGDLQVSESGHYRMLDITVTWQGAKGSQDTVLHLYDGVFDPGNPSANRVAEFNRSFTNFVNDEEWVQLEPGRSYTVVLQLACDTRPGLGGFNFAGPGNITGVGFETPSYAYGNFADVETTAEFPWGAMKWAGNYAYTAPATGYYYMVDGGGAWPDFGGVPAAPMAYSQPFDPQDPQANHLWGGVFGQSSWGFFMEKGQTVWWVYVDVYEGNSVYQTILYTPGALAGINRGLTGSFSNPDMDGQGILLEADDVYSYLFGALFTFDDSALASTEEVGTSDQRWLSVYGFYTQDDPEMPLTWENSSGGRFNSVDPPVVQDAEYGIGKLVAKDCENIELHYSLPDTPDGVFEFQRLWTGKSRYCYENLNVAPPLN